MEIFDLWFEIVHVRHRVNTRTRRTSNLSVPSVEVGDECESFFRQFVSSSGSVLMNLRYNINFTHLYFKNIIYTYFVDTGYVLLFHHHVAMPWFLLYLEEMTCLFFQ